MIRMLKISLAAFALVGLATTLVPQASAWTCVGVGAGGEVAQACNEARETAYETADYVIDHLEQCVPGFRWTCVHYP